MATAAASSSATPAGSGTTNSAGPGHLGVDAAQVTEMHHGGADKARVDAIANLVILLAAVPGTSGSGTGYGCPARCLAT